MVYRAPSPVTVAAPQKCVNIVKNYEVSRNERCNRSVSIDKDINSSSSGV